MYLGSMNRSQNIILFLSWDHTSHSPSYLHTNAVTETLQGAESFQFPSIVHLEVLGNGPTNEIGFML